MSGLPNSWFNDGFTSGAPPLPCCAQSVTEISAINVLEKFFTFIFLSIGSTDNLISVEPSSSRAGFWDTAATGSPERDRVGWFGCGWFGRGWFGCSWFGRGRFWSGWFGCSWFGCSWFECGWFGCCSTSPVGCYGILAVMQQAVVVVERGLAWI